MQNEPFYQLCVFVDVWWWLCECLFVSDFVDVVIEAGGAEVEVEVGVGVLVGLFAEVAEGVDVIGVVPEMIEVHNVYSLVLN